MRKLANQPVTVASTAVFRQCRRRGQPLDVKTHIESMEQHARKQIGKDHAYQPREQAEHNELDAEDSGDVISLRSQRLKHYHLANPAKACAGDARGQDDSARKDGKGREKTNHDRDLPHHSLDGLKHIRDVDYRYRGVLVEERALHRTHLIRSTCIAPYQTTGSPASARGGRINSLRAYTCWPSC